MRTWGSHSEGLVGRVASVLPFLLPALRVRDFSKGKDDPPGVPSVELEAGLKRVNSNNLPTRLVLMNRAVEETRKPVPASVWSPVLQSISLKSSEL